MNRDQVEALVVSWAAPLAGRPSLRALADLADAIVAAEPMPVRRAKLPAPEVVVPPERRLVAPARGASKAVKARAPRTNGKASGAVLSCQGRPGCDRPVKYKKARLCHPCYQAAWHAARERTSKPRKSPAPATSKSDDEADPVGTPNPTQLTDQAGDALERLVRKTACASYNDCLSYVTKQKWPQWTCVACPLAREATA